MSLRGRAGMLVMAATLCGCGGGGGTVSAAPGATSPVSWVATLRSNPTALHLTLSNPLPQYMYIDAGATNGVYPSPDVFAAQIQGANPGFPAGACSRIAQMSATVVEFTDSNGIQAPAYVVFFTPRAVGSCAQSLQLGAAGTQTFSVTVDA
jgi:hypothetical protein